MGIWTRTPRAWDSLAVTPAALPQALNDDLRAMALGFGPMTAYTSSVGGTGWAIGNGTITAKYLQVQKFVAVNIEVTFGSSSTFGAGQLTLGLPVSGVDWSWRGIVELYDAGTSNYLGWGYLSGSTFYVEAVNANFSYAGRTAVTSSVPHTWASTDLVRLGGIYMAS